MGFGFDHVLVGTVVGAVTKVRGGSRSFLRPRKKAPGSGRRRSVVRAGERDRERPVDAVHAEREGAVYMARSAR